MIPQFATITALATVLWASTFSAFATFESIPWSSAKQYVGKEVVITGTVRRGYQVNDVCYLKFDDAAGSLILVASGDWLSYNSLSPLHSAYTNQSIRVFGVITQNDERNRPELRITQTSQFLTGEYASLAPPPKQDELKKIPSSTLTPRITASTVQTIWAGEGPAAAILDGNDRTRWSSAYADEQSVDIDLGRVQLLGGLNLHWEVAAAKEYTVYVSETGKVWREVAKREKGGRGPRVDEIRFGLGLFRHIRLHLEQRATEFGFSLYEVELLGHAGPTDQ